MELSSARGSGSEAPGGDGADREATIGRFTQRNRERIEEVFKACVRKAYAGGLIGLVVYVVDGTKVAAQVSQGKSLHRGD